MSKMLSVYPADSDLRTPERKDLYKRVLNDVKGYFFGNTPKGFSQALKVLFFEGKVEALSPQIRDERELFNSRCNALGPQPYAFICLASPIVSVDFYESVLLNYKEIYFRGGIAGIFSQRCGFSHWDADLVERFSILLQVLDEAPSADGVPGAERIKLTELYFFFFGLISRLETIGSSRFELCKRVLPRFYKVFSEAALGAEKLKSISQPLGALFGGEARCADSYSDGWFIDFFCDYLDRSFPAGFLTFLDDVYGGVPSARRIRWDEGRIVNY